MHPLPQFPSRSHSLQTHKKEELSNIPLSRGRGRRRRRRRRGGGEEEDEEEKEEY